MRALRRLIGVAVVLVILIAAALLLFGLLRGKPQDLPWTPLHLTDSIGLFTGRKLTALGQDFPKCRALLEEAGVHYKVLPAVNAGQCGYADAIRFSPGGSRQSDWAPANVGVSCPVAAALSVWEWDVVQPAARKLLGSPVVAIDHYGAYNCRRIAGESAWSEHATANAIDVAAFRLADGTRISVLDDWKGNGPKATFLHQVRNGACKLFATTLSPDYNAAHRNHLHVDQAARGALGWRACR